MGAVHKIIERGITPDGIKIQIEDWRECYPGVYTTLTIGCYPIAKQSSRYFIKKGEVFRCEINKIDTDEEAIWIFNQLVNGEIKIEDLGDRITDSKYKYYLGLIEEEPWI